MLEPAAETILNIISDYRNDDGIQLSIDEILSWVHQFAEEDRLFILEELINIFSRMYISKTAYIEFIKQHLEELVTKYKYVDLRSFLSHSKFLDLQNEHKSQKDILSIVNQIITDFGIPLDQIGSHEIHNYIYIDDILATGNNVYQDLAEWLSKQEENITNSELVKENKQKVIVSMLCAHTWGASNVEFRLMKLFGDDIKKHINLWAEYIIDNNIKGLNPKLNLAYPIDNQPNEVKLYLHSLEATANEDRAFRKEGTPKSEVFFSSPQNRIRFENIILWKGLELLSNVANLRVKNLRPLGYTIKSHKTLGLGSLFFTWRNIPNNCPIVFWWESARWQPLFKVKNRGI